MFGNTKRTCLPAAIAIAVSGVLMVVGLVLASPTQAHAQEIRVTDYQSMQTAYCNATEDLVVYLDSDITVGTGDGALLNPSGARGVNLTVIGSGHTVTLAKNLELRPNAGASEISFEEVVFTRASGVSSASVYLKTSGVTYSFYEVSFAGLTTAITVGAGNTSIVVGEGVSFSKGGTSDIVATYSAAITAASSVCVSVGSRGATYANDGCDLVKCYKDGAAMDCASVNAATDDQPLVLAPSSKYCFLFDGEAFMVTYPTNVDGMSFQLCKSGIVEVDGQKLTLSGDCVLPMPAASEGYLCGGYRAKLNSEGNYVFTKYEFLPYGTTVTGSVESGFAATLNTYQGTDVDLVIPERVLTKAYGEVPATAIGNSFSMTRVNGTVRSIAVPDTIQSIGTRFGANCNALNKVVLGSGITSIGEGFLSGVVGPVTIVVPNDEVKAVAEAACMSEGSIGTQGHTYSVVLAYEMPDGAVLGDVNNNGKVNVIDAQVAFDLGAGRYGGDASERLLACWAPGTVLGQVYCVADVNCDGEVDAADALAIQCYAHNGAFGKVVD